MNECENSIVKTSVPQPYACAQVYKQALIFIQIRVRGPHAGVEMYKNNVFYLLF